MASGLRKREGSVLQNEHRVPKIGTAPGPPRRRGVFRPRCRGSRTSRSPRRRGGVPLRGRLSSRPLPYCPPTRRQAGPEATRQLAAATGRRFGVHSVPAKIRAIRGPAAYSLAAQRPFPLVRGHAGRVSPSDEEPTGTPPRRLIGTARHTNPPAPCHTRTARRPPDQRDNIPDGPSERASNERHDASASVISASRYRP